MAAVVLQQLLVLLFMKMMGLGLLHKFLTTVLGKKESKVMALLCACNALIYIFSKYKIVYTVYFVAYQKAAVQCVKCGVKAVMREL